LQLDNKILMILPNELDEITLLRGFLGLCHFDPFRCVRKKSVILL
jgi:hypothetical protein